MLLNSAQVGTVQFSFRHLSQNKTKMNSEANTLHKKVSFAKKQCAFERRNTMVTVELLKLTIEIYCNRFSTSVKSCF